jgi:endonuclease/exonuclease/phosphatase family metal-dependent hydrolase
VTQLGADVDELDRLGDFNQRPGELAENARQFDLDGRVDVANDRDRATNRGGSTIDYVLVSPDIEPVDTDIEPGVSDHHSVIVEVELPG